MAARKNFESEALQYTYDKYIGNDPDQVASYELINIELAKLLYDLRTKAGLSQRELAKKVGTTASVICRLDLEDADYEGHSLSMLKRIAAALKRRVEIRFVPIRKRAPAHPIKTLRRKRESVRALQPTR